MRHWSSMRKVHKKMEERGGKGKGYKRKKKAPPSWGITAMHLRIENNSFDGQLTDRGSRI